MSLILVFFQLSYAMIDFLGKIEHTSLQGNSRKSWGSSRVRTTKRNLLRENIQRRMPRIPQKMMMLRLRSPPQKKGRGPRPRPRPRRSPSRPSRPEMNGGRFDCDCMRDFLHTNCSAFETGGKATNKTYSKCYAL